MFSVKSRDNVRFIVRLKELTFFIKYNKGRMREVHPPFSLYDEADYSIYLLRSSSSDNPPRLSSTYYAVISKPSDTLSPASNDRLSSRRSRTVCRRRAPI